MDTITQMSDEQFAEIIDGYISQAATSNGEIPAETFTDLLRQRVEGKVEEVVNLAVQINNQEVVLMPDHDLPDIVVNGNEIFVGKHRFVLHLSPV